MKISTFFVDGQYMWQPTPHGKVGKEVDDATIELWRAISETVSAMQRQLREIDDELLNGDDS